MTAPNLTPVPLSPKRLAEIRESIPPEYPAPWETHHEMVDGYWLIGYATDNPLAGLVAKVPDYGFYLAEFIAAARAAVPELLAEVDRLSKRVAELEAALPSRSASTPLRVEQHLARVLDEDVHLRYQQAIGDRAVSEAARDIRMETNALKAHGVLEHDKFRACRDAARQIERGGPYPSALVRFGCGAEVTS